MNLLHYSEEPVAFDRARTYVQPEPEFYQKPAGLWVSVEGEDDWPSWCRGEEFNPEGLRVSHRVTLAPGANVLLISTGKALDEFHETYAVGNEPYAVLRKASIDWRKVATDYDGIIIAPYRWNHRLSHLWYYGWDCASGCIWNLDAIQAFA